ncbi:PAS domain-containing protein [Pedobacter petrophilus]|uniref:histidine kinase n=1 Tax=Pedobacter petrophilus TaxID=1908241 RepID=A0A7K0G576_9SPHI|nr:PAS domain-containing sensor histidine kinase [Pedobacter petrophilus]MRX78524.1 PAS domain-containing protein [Pedobacter petrophilus]
MPRERRLKDNQIIQILCRSDDAVAIYTGEEILIEVANPAMQAAWGRDASVIGLTLSEALPEIEDQPFLGMLQEVWRTGIDNVGTAIPAELLVDGKLQHYYFDYAYRAVKDENGQVYAIFHTARDVTEKVNDREELKVAREREELLEREQALNEELAAANEELFATNEDLSAAQERLRILNQELEDRVDERTAELSRSESRLRYLLSDAPVAIAVLRGRELIVESANKMVLNAWGKTDEIIGKTLPEAIPELDGQEFLGILDAVYTEGEPFYGSEVKALLRQNGRLEEVYFNFVYQPIKDEAGKTNGIMITASIVTEQVFGRNQVQHLNEELIAINEELNESQDLLMSTNLDLKASEMRLDKIISELPVPVVVLMGPDQIIATTNEALLKYWDRTKEEVTGKTMLQVFPELKSQPYPDLWKRVLAGEGSVASIEIPVTYKDKLEGTERSFYIDYHCQALTDLGGNNVGVISTILDVTEKVRSRKQIEKAEAQLRLAIESSELGTWYIDVITREFKPSRRLKQIFGFYEEEDMLYDATTNQILDEYRQLVTEAVDHAILNGTSYDMEYPIKGFRDGAIRWVRATGKLYGEDANGHASFSGTVQNITQRKLEEQRKDDFLSIASHELKTPITTLKGALQLLNRYKDNLSSAIVPRLIEQANGSVEKITNLIDDLLNTTRTNEGQLHLNLSTFIVSKLLDDCCQHVRIGGKHDLIVQGDLQLEVEADEARIDQVVVNLVNNATKYAPDSRKIYLLIEDLGHLARVSVRDSGPGIPEEKIPHLFDRYYRADYGGAQYSGLGLGLYISAEIIKRHNGEIGVESKPGEGSTFWFTVPKKVG